MTKLLIRAFIGWVLPLSLWAEPQITAVASSGLNPSKVEIEASRAFPWLDRVPENLKAQRDLFLLFMNGEISIEEIQDDQIWQFLGGGDIIGNGGGLLESYFFSAYEALPRYISECLRSPLCKPTQEERVLLTRIADIAKKNRDLSYSLIFLGREKGQNLFDRTDPTRVAMTGFRPGLPIFINLDKIYDTRARSAIERSDAIAILTHEVGHQTGERSHSKLDRLGVLLKDFVTAKTLTLNFQRPEMPRYEVWIENTTGDLDQLVAYISNRYQRRSFKQVLAERIQCPQGYSLYSFELSNAHWIYSENANAPSLGLWVDLQCVHNETKEIHDVFDVVELALAPIIRSFRPLQTIK